MRRAVLAATVRLLVSRPYGDVTVAAVAQAAGVHETTVYRHWRTRENLIHDAARACADRALPLPDTGDVRTDLRTLAASLVRLLASPEGRALLRIAVRPADEAPGTKADAQRRAAFWADRLARAETLVHRGKERGEIGADRDAALVIEALCAPLLTRALLAGGTMDDGFVARLVDQVVDGAAPR
nr:TetR-like C-terminal domain-containing protein [Streptomyces sp. RFCAC02]